MNIGKSARYGACLTLALLVDALAAAAQSFVLQTGGTESLVSDSHLLDAISGPEVFLRFDFGMATAEEALSGSFLDSVTFSLEGASSAATTIFATQDSSGVLWAPPVPGGISLNPASVTWTEIAFPEIGFDWPNRHAYRVTAPIPAELLGEGLIFRVDLFDNGNGVNSGVFGSAFEFVPVPEPETIGLATGLALAGVAFLFKLNRRNR